MTSASRAVPRRRSLPHRLIVVLIASGLLAVAVFAILYFNARAEAKPSPEPRQPLPVTTVLSRQVASYTVDSRFAGRVEAIETSELAFELGGLVRFVAVEEGDRVAAGDPLAQLDTALLEDEKERLAATATALRARLDFARKTLARQRDLADKGFSPTAVLDEARSEVDSLRAEIVATEAAVRSVATRIGKSTLTAPYDGVVAARRVDPGAVVAAGAPVLRLTDAASPRLRVGVPPDMIAGLRLGQRAEAAVAGRTIAARLEAVLPEIDPSTRTVPVLFRLQGDWRPALGQVVRLGLERRVAKTGTWLPREALSEGDKGLWTVLVIDRTRRPAVVVRESVQIQHGEADRVYVRGTLADGAEVVATGVHRLVPGQPVDPRPVETGRAEDGG